jgi:hypothetical protein
MTDEGPMSRQITHHGVLQKLDPYLLAKKAPAPPVVVSPEQCHGDARGHHVPQHLKSPAVTLGGTPAVLEPEVEEITVEHDTARLVRRGSKPIQKGLLVLGRCGAQVDVGSDKYGAVWHGAEG